MEMKRAFGGQLERIKTEMNGKGQERKDNKDEEYEKRTLNAHELTILVKSA